ncbi:MAG: helix-turn-helix domain-containing protein [Pseudonocardiaceae bacterium]
MSLGHEISCTEESAGVIPRRARVELFATGKVTMGDREPTIRSRELGEGLRQVMERAGLTGHEAAHLLDCSPSRVSRLLSGKRGGSEVDVAAFLGVCRVKVPERDRLLGLCQQQQHTPGWFQQYGTRLPKQLRTLIDNENQAVAISVFASTLFPDCCRPGTTPGP